MIRGCGSPSRRFQGWSKHQPMLEGQGIILISADIGFQRMTEKDAQHVGFLFFDASLCDRLRSDITEWIGKLLLDSSKAIPIIKATWHLQEGSRWNPGMSTTVMRVQGHPDVRMLFGGSCLISSMCVWCDQHHQYKPVAPPLITTLSIALLTMIEISPINPVWPSYVLALPSLIPSPSLQNDTLIMLQYLITSNHPDLLQWFNQ